MMKLKAGKYYVGDPCYVVKDNEWIPLLERTGNLDNNNGEFVYRGCVCFNGDTAWGDGMYFDNESNLYLVDSGGIAIMPIECLSKNKVGRGGQIIDFPVNFDVVCVEGVFNFGHIIIDTLNEEYEDDED